MQLFDGVLTYWGVLTFGVDVEGNPLVKYVIIHLGEFNGLLAVKLTAILTVLYIQRLSIYNSRCIIFLMLFVNVIYSLAVLGWFFIFFTTVFGN